MDKITINLDNYDYEAKTLKNQGGASQISGTVKINGFEGHHKTGRVLGHVIG